MREGVPLLAARAAARRFGSQSALEPTELELWDGEAALYDASPWGRLAREALWLCGLGALFGVLARLGTRRLLA